MTDTPRPEDDDVLVDEPAEVSSEVSDEQPTLDPVPYHTENTRKMRRTISFGLSGLIALFAIGFIVGRNTARPVADSDASQSVQEAEPRLQIADIEQVVRAGTVVWGADVQRILEEYDTANENVGYNFSDKTIEISGNGLPNHEIGRFPNTANPNSILSQNVSFSIPRQPTYVGEAVESPLFGVSLGGVVMIPGTTERDLVSGWRIEAFNVSRLFDPGADDNNGAVQANGRYSYLGYPAVLDSAGSETHSNLIGFAADGFPVYGNRGYRDPTNPNGPVDGMTSSWRLKKGERGPGEPPGVYTGDYTRDFEYIAESGDLDACNGRFTVTPEFPSGTYAYFMTRSFPFIGRCVNGELLDSFETVD